MIPTMPQRRRRRPQLNVTPCDVDITPGIVVFWDHDQRSGTLHDVPMYLAMHWQKHGWATIVDEPVGAGAASNTADIPMQAAATTAPSYSESDELRDIGTDHTDDEPPWPPPPGPGKHGTPRHSDTFQLYGSPQIRSTKAVTAQKNSEEAVSVASLTGDGDRTGSVRVRRCPNCSAPVSGRRKWCSEACRLQAYRGRP
jgi:hypothetical protein